jgi:hypothetical protein
MMWLYTTPPYDVGENYTAVVTNQTTAESITFPENSSQITTLNETTIIVTHNPPINATIEAASLWTGSTVYTVESVGAEIINASITIDDENGTKTYREFERTTEIERNRSENITFPLPVEFIEPYLLSPLRSFDPNFKLSLSPYADKEVIIEVRIIEVYNAES